MRLTVQKRLAAQILGCSEKKVWLDPEQLDEVREAITKQDIRRLISSGLIKKKQTPFHSRGNARIKKMQKQKGRGKGAGRRKGKAGARTPKKRTWINLVRAQRELLRELKAKNIIKKQVYNELINKVKGGFFRSRRHIKIYLNEHSLLNPGRNFETTGQSVQKDTVKKEKQTRKTGAVKNEKN